MRTTVKKSQVLAAIDAVNEKYGYKLQIRNNDKQLSTNHYQFTLRSEKSGIPGSCYSATGRRQVSASWHAHGYFFDELFKINPEAIVWSKNNKITINQNNWEDFNVGSFVPPVYASKLSIL